MTTTEELWRRFSDALRAYLRRRVGDEAEDLLQEVFVRVHARIEAQPPPERLGPWLFAIARNAAIDHARRAGRGRPLEVDVPAPEPDEADRELERALGAWLRAEVARLPEPYRSAVEATEVRGLSQKEAADQLGIPYSTLKSQVQRGRARLARALARCCAVERDARGNVLSVTPRQCGCS